MDTTNEELKESMSPFKNVMLTIMLVAAALAVYFGLAKFNDLSPESATSVSESMPASAVAVKQNPSSNAKNVLASGAANKTTAQVDPASRLTYRLGITRPIRKMDGELNSYFRNANKHWWLYAKTEEDAQWFDRYGFPTPAEEQRLEAASDAELSELVAMGDENAKAHLAIRAAKLAVMSGVELDARTSSGDLSLLVTIGGPYQAFMVMQGVQEMLYAYDRLPPSEQTAAQRKAIEDFSRVQMFADAMGTAYGDKNFFIARNRWRPRGGVFQEFQPKQELSATEAANRMAHSARVRIDAGLPPLTIVPRPDSEYRIPVYFDRY